MRVPRARMTEKADLRDDVRISSTGSSDCGWQSYLVPFEVVRAWRISTTEVTSSKQDPSLVLPECKRRPLQVYPVMELDTD